MHRIKGRLNPSLQILGGIHHPQIFDPCFECRPGNKSVEGNEVNQPGNYAVVIDFLHPLDFGISTINFLSDPLIVALIVFPLSFSSMLQ